MRARQGVSAWLLGVLAASLVFATSGASAAGGSAPALTGIVTSTEGTPLEGVVVSAGHPGSNITVSVVTGANGRYSFPAGKLAPGGYFLSIRATGYELDGAGAAQVGAPNAATDLKLKSAHDLAAQLTNAEWILSFPGTDQQKSMLVNCVGCHTLERVARSTHTADEWVTTIDRMNHYAQVSQPIKPQKRVGAPENTPAPELVRRQAEYLASINLSATPKWQYPLKTLSRVTGRGTRVVITEYGLPRPTVEPHDVILDGNGRVWYSDFGEMTFGSVDPKTGKVTEYPVKTLKPGYPVGMLDLERDHQGNFWLGAMFQGALAKFDRKTDKFQFWSLPKAANDDVAQINMVTTKSDVSGKVWTNNVGHGDIYRLDLKTGQYQHFMPYSDLPADSPMAHRPHAIYGLASDSHDNLFFTDFVGRWIGRIDAQTGKASFYATPTDNSRPRRGQMDGQDRFWFAEYGANRVAMLDTKSGTFREWEMPTAWTAPYDVTIDKNGEIWTGGMTTDRIVRLDPKNGTAVEYPMPRDTNIRRVFVDEQTTPVTFWAGSNHDAAVVKVEPLD
ncbi:MAG TPA: carboxypeptidase regulatory-like domain-containing protein [Stellaceae bacterium]